jgi:hypothetical protein
MSKTANAGELRTEITITQIAHTTDEEGYPSDGGENVFGAGRRCA